MNNDVTTIIGRVVEKGDTEAYGQLVQDYSNAAFSVALSVLGNREDARDIAQDAFVMAYEMLPDLRDTSKFGCWLKRIVSGLAKNFLRDRQRRITAHTAAWRQDISINEGPPAQAAGREEEEAVYLHIQALPERHRTVIIMKYLEEMRYEEIASFLELSERTVKMLSFEAKRLLLARLKKDGIETPTILDARRA